MEPGDFVLWDSRTAHYGAAPLEDKKRFAICESSYLAALTLGDICYKPDAFMTPEQRERKVEAFKKGYCTVSRRRMDGADGRPMTRQTLSSRISRMQSGTSLCPTAHQRSPRRRRRRSAWWLTRCDVSNVVKEGLFNVLM